MSANRPSTAGRSSLGDDGPLAGPDVLIDDIAPQRTRDFGDLVHAAGALIIAVIAVLFAVYLRGITSGVESDVQTAGQAVSWLMDVPAYAVQQLSGIVVVVGVLTYLVANREWIQSIVCALAMFAGYAAVWGLSTLLSQLGPPTLLAAVDSLSTVHGTALLPDIYAGISALLTAAGPSRMRKPVKWGWNVLYTLAIVLVVISWNSVVGVVVSLSVGRLLGAVIRFAIGTQNKGLWGMQIVEALHGIGIQVVSLARRQTPDITTGVLHATLDDDLIENSRIYDIEDRSGAHYIVSALDNQLRAAGYLNQLWQWLRLSGVPMRRDRSAADANHHHLAMLLGLNNIGLPTADVYGVADSGESSLLVFTVDAVALPCELDTLRRDDAEQLMRYLGEAHARGYTHRRITPETIGRLQDGSMVIAGWQNGDCASTPANATLDRVQLLTLLCASIGVDQAVACAREAWGEPLLIAMTPFVQKVAIPKATQALPQWNRELFDDLRGSLNALSSPEAGESTEDVSLSRFSLRSFLAITLAVIAVTVIFTQLRPDAVIAAIRSAKPNMAVLCILFGFLAWIGSAVTLGVFMDKGKRQYLSLFCSQAAQGYVAVSMPAGMGPAFVNLQFLRKHGYSRSSAMAVMSATWAVQGLTTVVLMLGIGVFTGRNTLSGMIPTNMVIIIIGAVALLVSAAMAIPPLRRMIVAKYVPTIVSFIRQLVEVFTRPVALAAGVAGALVLNIATGLGFWAALLAFGYQANPVETLFLFLLANTLGSAAPTPGGLGAVEAALTFAFTSVGVPTAISLSAVLVYRVAFYWLRIPVGYVAMRWLKRHHQI